MAAVNSVPLLAGTFLQVESSRTTRPYQVLSRKGDLFYLTFEVLIFCPGKRPPFLRYFIRAGIIVVVRNSVTDLCYFFSTLMHNMRSMHSP